MDRILVLFIVTHLVCACQPEYELEGDWLMRYTLRVENAQSTSDSTYNLALSHWYFSADGTFTIGSNGEYSEGNWSRLGANRFEVSTKQDTVELTHRGSYLIMEYEEHHDLVEGYLEPSTPGGFTNFDSLSTNAPQFKDSLLYFSFSLDSIQSMEFYNDLNHEVVRYCVNQNCISFELNDAPRLKTAHGRLFLHAYGISPDFELTIELPFGSGPFEHLESLIKHQRARPVLSHAINIRDELPDSIEKRLIKDQLIGEWKSNGHPLQVWSQIDGYEISDSSWSLRLTTDSLFINSLATIIDDGQSREVQTSTTGTWYLGPSGKFLVVNYDSPIFYNPQHIDINSIDNQVLKLNMDLEHLWLEDGIIGFVEVDLSRVSP